MIKVNLKTWETKFLFILMPLYELLIFISDQYLHFSYFGTIYINIFLALFLIYKVRNHQKLFISLILLLIYAICLAVFSEGELIRKLSHVLRFLLAVIYIVVFSYVNMEGDPKKNLVFMQFFTIIFILVYYFSIFFTGQITFYRNSAVSSEMELYTGSFIIMHSFGYYCVALFYYFANEKSFSFMTLVGFASIFSLRRTTLLLFLITIVFLIANKTITFKQIRVFLLIPVIIIILRFMPVELANFSYSVESLVKMSEMGTKLLAPTSTSDNLTSSRTFYLDLGITEMKKENSFGEWIVGRGALAAENFIYPIKGYKSWFLNDYMEIIFNWGIAGILIYLFTIFLYKRKWQSYYLPFYAIFAGLSNGFYHYDTLQYLILITLINQEKQKRVPNEK